MAHEVFEEPMTLVLWLVLVVVLLGAVLIAGMQTSKLLTMIFLRVFNNKLSVLLNIASAMPEGSEIYIPIKPDYGIGTTTVLIHQSYSNRYVEVISQVKLGNKTLSEIKTISPYTGLFATHKDPVLLDKYISINYLYQTSEGFGYISPYSGAFISKAEAVKSQTPLQLEKVQELQMYYKDNLVTIQELYWVYKPQGSTLHLKKQDGLLIIEKT